MQMHVHTKRSRFALLSPMLKETGNKMEDHICGGSSRATITKKMPWGTVVQSSKLKSKTRGLKELD